MRGNLPTDLLLDHIPALIDEIGSPEEDIAATWGSKGNGTGTVYRRRVREVARGKVDVHSEEGVGATFTIQSPRKVPPLGLGTDDVPAS